MADGVGAVSTADSSVSLLFDFVATHIHRSNSSFSPVNTFRACPHFPPISTTPIIPLPFRLRFPSLRFSAAMRKPCCHRDIATKGSWSKQEDQKLIDYIQSHGRGCWRSLPTAAGLLRSGKSCRLRWINYLKPDIKRGNFTPDEEDLIIKLHALLGNRWSLIAGRLPGRTDNDVKNYWNSHLRRKLISMGIDPNNHRLNHTLLPLPQPADRSSATPLSSTNQLSDDASSVEDESSQSCYLNLDLSIGFPSNSPKITEDEKPQIKLLEPTMTAKEVGDEPNPALLLFT